ncbi:MAG TPA: GNAT family N-acetyltransferase [Pseudonocardiaceae bacterium]|jgi:RimJ/RimL family protein N-acetyltransferase
MHTVLIRHFICDDVPLRAGLLRDGGFQANLTDFAVSAQDDRLVADQLATIAQGQDVKRIFTLCTDGGQVVGFAWITDIDWPSRSCELSFAVLPRFRIGFGLAVAHEAQRYLHDELNMATVISQVLTHNTMLHKADLVARRRQVRCAYDSYTVGEWRTSCYWGQTRAQFASEAARFLARRRERRERIRATVSSA